MPDAYPMERLEFFVPSDRMSRNGGRRGFYGTNDLLRHARRSPYEAGKLKAATEAFISHHASMAMREAGWSAKDVLTSCFLTFVEPDSKRDEDNVIGAAKLVLDALCRPSSKHPHGCGAIWDDDPFHLSLHACVARERDRNKPGVRVRLMRRSDA